jgi:hypothetical protein
MYRHWHWNGRMKCVHYEDIRIRGDPLEGIAYPAALNQTQQELVAAVESVGDPLQVSARIGNARDAVRDTYYYQIYKYT